MENATPGHAETATDDAQQDAGDVAASFDAGDFAASFAARTFATAAAAALATTSAAALAAASQSDAQSEANQTNQAHASLVARVNEALVAAFQASGFGDRSAVSAMTKEDLARCIAAGIATVNLQDVDLLAETLLEAVYSGAVSTVRSALSSGASPDARTEAGHTALMVAIKRSDEKNLECATLLLDANANIEARTPRGRTALHIACEESIETVRACALPAVCVPQQ